MSDHFLMTATLAAFVLSLSVLVGAILLHLAVPRSLKEELARRGFFNEFELGLEFPFSVLRTLAIVRAIATPGAMKRNVDGYEVLASVAAWFATACRGYMWMIVAAAVAIGLTFVGFVQLVIQGRIDLLS